MDLMVQNKVRDLKTTGKYSYLLLLFWLAFASCVCYAQKAVVALSADKKEAAAGEQITFRVSTNIEGSINIDFPAEFELDNGIMHFMESKMDPSGKVKTYYIIQQSGSFRKNGTYSFVATVTRKNVPYKSNKITIEVDESAEQTLTIRSDDPVFGYVEASKTTVYEGEPVLLNAKIISKYPILKVEGYLPYKPEKGVEEHSFTSYREYIEETRLNGKKVQTFDYGKELIFPVSTGKCRIKPFEMALRCHSNIFDRTYRFKSTGLSLTVKPLPKGAPASFIGAVGEFDLKHELSATENLKVGDVVTLKLIVSGTGNLHNIQNPKLILPSGCKLYGDPERDEAVQFTESGATGNIEFLYHIQITDAGDFKFDAPAIAYFDPKKEKYITIQSTPFDFSIAGKNDALAVNTPDTPDAKGSPEMHALNVDKEGAKNEGSALPLILGIALPGTTFALFFLFLMMRRKQNKRAREKEAQQEITQSIPAFQATVPVSDTDFWAEVLAHKDDPNSVAISLPKAIIQVLEQKLGLIESSREKVLQTCAETDKDLERELREIISTCDHFRYGFGVKELPATALIDRVGSLLKLSH